jgi:hypothetical protein
MATVILHLGPPKTGTTSIQTFLFQNRLNLLEQGIVYPDQVNHQDIYNFFKFNLTDTPKTLLDSIDITKKIDGTLLISCEFFSSFSTNELQRFKKYFISQGLNNVNVFFFIRESTATTLSSRQELLKKGFTFSDPELHGVSIRYSQLWARIVSVFDYNQLNFYLYEEENFDVVDKFLQVHKIKIPYKKNIMKNTSLSFQECCLMSYLNKKNIKYNIKTLQNSLKSIRKNKFGGWSHECEFLIETAREENKWLEDNTGLKFNISNDRFDWYEIKEYDKTLTLFCKTQILPSFFSIEPLQLRGE